MTRSPDASTPDDARPSAVPGPEDADSGTWTPSSRRLRPGRTRPLDMSKDPDRFVPDATAPATPRPQPPAAGARAPRLDPARDPDRYDNTGELGLDDLMAAPTPTRAPRIDPTADPDRYRTSAGAGQNLEEVLGKDRTHEGDRSGFEWIAGLLAVLAFIVVVAYLFGNVLTP